MRNDWTSIRALAGLLCIAWITGCAETGPGPGGDPTLPGESVMELAARETAEPDEPYWPHAQGVIHLTRGEVTRALDDFQRALDRNPDYAPALSHLSALEYETGAHAVALERLAASQERHAQTGRSFPTPLLAALVLHADALDQLDLVDRWLPALIDDPQTAGVGAYLLLRGDGFSRAATPARAAAQANPESAPDQNNLGVTRLMSGDPEAAAQAFQAARDLDPELPGPHYNLALLEAFFLLDTDTARENFARYRSLATEDPDRLSDLLSTGTLAGK